MPGPKGTTYITDFGVNLEVKAPDGSTSELERYGVWVWSAGRRRHQVAEVGNDLPALMATYDVPADRVIPFPVGVAAAVGRQGSCSVASVKPTT